VWSRIYEFCWCVLLIPSPLVFAAVTYTNAPAAHWRGTWLVNIAHRKSTICTTRFIDYHHKPHGSSNVYSLHHCGLQLSITTAASDATCFNSSITKLLHYCKAIGWSHLLTGQITERYSPLTRLFSAFDLVIWYLISNYRQLLPTLLHASRENVIILKRSYLVITSTLVLDCSENSPINIYVMFVPKWSWHCGYMCMYKANSFIVSDGIPAVCRLWIRSIYIMIHTQATNPLE